MTQQSMLRVGACRMSFVAGRAKLHITMHIERPPALHIDMSTHRALTAPPIHTTSFHKRPPPSSSSSSRAQMPLAGRLPNGEHLIVWGA